MEHDDVLALPPRHLAQEQRVSYQANGYLLIENLIDADTVAKLNTVTDAFIERSRAQTESDTTFDLAPGHTA